MTWGAFSILLMVGVGGNGSKDLVSLVDAPQYFKSRGIELKLEKMLELAGKTPADGKEQVQQLLAIRWLGEHPEAVKKTGNARETLRAIADGKQGKDPQGFAADYARLALARLDGKDVSLHPLPLGSVRGEALAWFPKKCTIFGAADMRPPRGLPEERSNPLADAINRMMPPREKEQFFTHVERMGNIRIDRASIAMIPDANQPAETRMFIRLTGKGDRQRLIDFFRQEFRGATLTQRKEFGGQPIAIIDSKDQGPAIAIIGDTDVIMAGYPAGSHGPGAPRPFNQVAVVDEALGVRAGTKASLLTGPYAGTLRGVSPKANGLLIGDLPEFMRQAMTQGRGNPFRGFVQNFTVVLMRNAKGLKIRFTGGAANAKDAKGFVDGVHAAKQLALDGLKQLPPFIKIKPKTINAMRVVVKGVRVEAKDALLTGGAFVPEEVVRAGFDLVTMWFLGIAEARRAPRP
jgi:hypothetical protein